MNYKYFSDKLSFLVHSIRGWTKAVYAQDGDDIILSQLFSSTSNGFFVDVGAHHPFRFSNTYLLYKKGWNGINIDPNAESISLLNRYRSRDKNIQIAVSEVNEKVWYFSFKESALNYVSSIKENRYAKNDLLETQKLQACSLTKILNKYMEKDTSIDLLSVDAEQHDLAVLRSLDFKVYKPKVIVVEIGSAGLSELKNNTISSFLRKQGYVLEYKTFRNGIYRSIK